jgi:hypothetical protein
MTPVAMRMSNTVPRGNTNARAQRLVAFYLPQFYPFPENDSWWGKGFTEWTNVAKARPLFKGHYQPHLPADLGFYDLRLPEARLAQAELARNYGLHGFCYYHCWFEGRRLLDRPFREVLDSGRPDFPFCLCWANETWSRRWLGEEKAVLLKQTYSPEDDVNHARWLANAFSDPRYITISGRPIFLIYRPLDLPNPQQTTDVIRSEAVALGVAEPFLVGVDGHTSGRDFRKQGFDCTLAFQPQLGALPYAMHDGPLMAKLIRNARRGMFDATLKIYDEAETRTLMKHCQRDFPFIRSVFVSWDNTPRRGRNGIVFHESNPDDFQKALAGAMRAQVESIGIEYPVFINAWNEWAEGNHLEPDQKFGCEYLTRIRQLVTA